MKKLITNQSVKIDWHDRGTGRPSPEWNSSEDIHMDKTCNNKSKDTFTIKIPLNSDCEVTIDGKNGIKVPRKIRD
jgi:hypothetical protein